jgi:hypothetical protein
MALRFGTWNRSLYRTGLLKAVARKLAKFDLEPVAVQQVKWVKGGRQPADDYIFFFGNGLRTGFFVRRGIISATKRVQFISDRMLYITQRSC